MSCSYGNAALHQAFIAPRLTSCPPPGFLVAICQGRKHVFCFSLHPTEVHLRQILSSLLTFKYDFHGTRHVFAPLAAAAAAAAAVGYFMLHVS